MLLSGELAVSQFEATASGFNVQFNQNIDASTINLYDVEAGTLGAADVTVVGANSGNVKGSLVVNNNQISFIRDGGLLAPDTYTVTLRSAANGFKDLGGGLLDGDNNGVAGGNYINGFTINPTTALTVSIADFARGPAQKVNVAETDNGLAIKLSDGTNVTSVSLTLKYDPSLLKITQVNLGSTLPNGSTVQSDLSVPGILTLNITSPSAIGGSNIDLVRLLSEIPSAAPYGKAGVLDIANLSINNNTIAARDDDGVQAVAYFGEATDNQRYSALDGQRVLRVVIGFDSGFLAYPNIAPTIIADITGNGVLSSLDGTRVLQEVIGADLNRAEIGPVVPVILSNLANDTGLSSLDRITSIPTVTGTVTDDGTITTLRAGIDNTPVGSYVNVTADLVGNSFTFNRTRLEQILGTTLTDGIHTLHLQATDNANNTPSIVDLTFTLDTTLPTITSFALSAGSDTGTVGDNITAAAQVQLTGAAEAGATLTLNSVNVLAGAGGIFQLPGVALNNGANIFSLSAIDLAGNTAQSNLTITKQGVIVADVALQWNQLALEAIRLTVTDPPIASRILAMVGIAQYDTLAAIENTPAYLVKQTATGPISLDAALAKAAHTILYPLFPNQRTSFDNALNTLLNSLPDGATKTNALALGLSIGNAVLAIRANDGSDVFIDYSGSEQAGLWRPTAPMFDVADEPQWGDVTPFALTSPDQFRPTAPPALDSAAYATAVNEVKTLGVATGSTRNPDQTEQAQFWADGKGSYTPAGHWNLIAQQIALSKGNSLSSNIRLLAQLNVALADAGIAAWDAKYSYGLWRPIDAIQDAELDNNPLTIEDNNWTPLLITPSHPEYVSGHSTYSMAAAQILAATFGNNTAFSTTAFTLPGVTRNYTSFTQAAQEAGRSRIYGGIHYEFTNQAGQQLGLQVANAVLQKFILNQDTQAPNIIADNTPANTNSNITLTGQIVDNLSGVASAQFKIDNGNLQPLTLNAQGQFTINTTFLLNGTNDGLHTITILAKDAANNSATAFTRTFTLDTLLPIISLTSIADNATIDVSSRLTGIANPTGSNLTLLNYKFDNGTARAVIFDSTGSFDEALLFGSLDVGTHTLQLTARDAAGNSATLTRTVTVPALAPFTITSLTPTSGAGDVGVTQRPQINFSRAINTATLNANSFYATSPGGTKLAATIVPAQDGTFAWLFFSSPMPGGSQITLHVDGSKIRAVADGAFLDADGNGTAGGIFTSTFTTVSRTSIPGTKLVGKVVDPGPDLEPMTFDDIRRGADGIIHTADDVFLNPIAHAKVYILGQESNFVFTDANGDFELNDVPVGNVKLAVDGRTSTNAPVGVFFPEMVMDLDLLPGITQTVMSSMGTNDERVANQGRNEIYLPRVPTSTLQSVSHTTTTQITVNEQSAPNLTDDQRQALTLTVAPGSAIDESGQQVANVQIGMSTVPPELVRDMLPSGVLQHTFDITIQAPGVATFSEPLKIIFPNVFNAAPGTKLNILSFDHTTGTLVINGTGTVSADGLTVVSDEGSGIKAPGWHGMTPPGTNDNVIPDPTAPAPDIDGDGIPDVVDPDDDNDGTPDEDDDDSEYLIEVSIGANLFFDPPEFEYSAGVVLPSQLIEDVTGNDLNQPFAWTGETDFFDTIEKPFSVGRSFHLSKFLGDLVPTGSVSLFSIIGGVELSAGLGLFGGFEINGGTPVIHFEDLVLRPGNVQLDFTFGIADTYLCYLPGGIGNFICQEFSAGPFTLFGPPSIELPDFSASLPFVPRIDYSDDFSIGLSASISASIGLSPFVSITKTLVPKANAQPLTVASDFVSQNSFPSVSVTAVQATPGTSTLASLMPASDIYYLYRVENGTQFRGSVGRGEVIQQFLPTDTGYSLYLFDPQTNRSSIQSGKTGLSVNQSTRTVPMSQIGGVDNDSDGISDIGEYVLGTNSTVVDSDYDGLSDLAELQQGLDPTGGLSLPVGVVSITTFQGGVESVSTLGGVGASGALTAVVATGAYGLATVDASQFTKPRVLVELDLPGNNSDVATDGFRRIAAVAANDAGLHIVDISNPEAPVLRETIAFGSSATRVEVRDGIAYVAVGSNISTVDLNTGDIRTTLNLANLGGSTLTDITIDGTTLFTMDSGRTLRAITVAGDILTPRGSLTLATGGGKIFVGNGVAYIGGTSGFQQGFSTVNVSNSAALQLLSNPDATNIANGTVVANGSGLAVTVGNLPGLGNVVHVVDVTDPSRTDRFLTQYALAATPRDLALANGLAFVADGTGGLQIVNYIGFDTKGIAPAVTISVDGVDADPGTPGVQVLEGRTVRVLPIITDDVQVRNVELLVNGQVFSNDVSFPFELFTQAPTIAAGGNTLTLQVRATDTGGNVGLSNIVTLSVVPDTFPPQVTSVSVDEGARRFFVRSIDINFDEPLDVARLSTTGVSLVRAGTDNTFGTADDVTVPVRLDTRSFGQSLSVLVDGFLPPGDYQFRIDPSIVADPAGNVLAAAILRHFTIRPASDVKATSGVPEISTTPSANPGQQIGIGVPFDPATARAQFNVIDANGTVTTRVVTTVRSDVARGIAYFTVPLDATTGDAVVYSLVGTVRTDFPDGTFPLQILPVITGVEVQSVATDGSSAVVVISGLGFVEGSNSEYRFSSETILDAGVNTGPNVTGRSDAVLGFIANGSVTITVPLSALVFGAINIKTAGGTSASYSVNLGSITSVAFSGTPADGAQASANAGQAVTLNGSGLSVNTDVLLRYVDISGNLQMVKLNPSSAAAGGTSATLVIPAYANGAFTLQVFGSASQPLLQIVPTLTGFDIDSRTILFGSGFVEGASSYSFAGVNLTDTAADASTIDVYYNVDFSAQNGSVNINRTALPEHGLGNVVVTTAGGTSTALALNTIRVDVVGTSLGDVAVNAAGNLWVSDYTQPGHLLRIDAATGQVLQTITLTAADFGTPYMFNYSGLQVLSAAMTLGATNVPAGSLLVFNGYPTNDRVIAINPGTGAVIASLTLDADYDLTGGVFDAASGRIFITESRTPGNRIIAISPTTGAQLATFTTPFTFGSWSGLAIDPTTGHLWLGTYTGGAQLVEYQVSAGGALTELRRLDTTAQGLDQNEISGLSFAADGSLYVASIQGEIYKINTSLGINSVPTATFRVAAETIGTIDLSATLAVDAETTVVLTEPVLMEPDSTDGMIIIGPGMNTFASPFEATSTSVPTVEFAFGNKRRAEDDAAFLGSILTAWNESDDLKHQRKYPANGLAKRFNGVPVAKVGWLDDRIGERLTKHDDKGWLFIV